MEQIGVGALAGTAHPPADLVQLSEAEEVRPVDDQRVDRGHVDAGLDDGRAHEDVIATLPEVEDDGFEAALVHLPVRDRDARLGHQVAQLPGDPVDVRHTVVHVERLPLAQELTTQRLADRGGILMPLRGIHLRGGARNTSEDDLQTLAQMMGWPEVPMQSALTQSPEPAYADHVREHHEDRRLIDHLASLYEGDIALYEDALRLRARRHQEAYWTGPSGTLGRLRSGQIAQAIGEDRESLTA